MWIRSKRLILFGAVLLGTAFFCEDLLAQQANMPAFFSRRKSNTKRSDIPTTIESAAMDIDIAHDKATLIGNVVVDDQDMKITCDKMIIYLEEKTEEPGDAAATAGSDKKTDSEGEDPAGGKQLKKIECFGEVVIVRRADPKDAKAKDMQANSDYALYNLKDEVIELTGRPILTSGSDRVNADKIIFFMKNDNVRLYGGKITYYGDTSLPGDQAEKIKNKD